MVKGVRWHLHNMVKQEYTIGDKVTLNPDLGYSAKQCQKIMVVDEIHCNGSITAFGGTWKGIPTCTTLNKSHFKLSKTK